MDATLPLPRASKRRPIAALGKLTIASLLTLGLLFVLFMTLIIGEIIPPLLVIGLLAVVFGGFIAAGWRWAPALATLLGGAVLAMFWPPMQFSLLHPEESRVFSFMAATIATLLLTMVAGLAATIQNYRRAAEERRTPRGLIATVTAVVGLVAGAVLVASIPQQGAGAAISPDVLAGLPAFGAKNFEFEQKELRVKAGENVALRLENADHEGHYFVVDELKVAAFMPAGKQGVALFKPTAPGTYTFYCTPHYDKASGEGMSGKLIVE